MEITALKGIVEFIKWLIDNPYFLPIAVSVGIWILRQKFEKIGKEQSEKIDKKLNQIKIEVNENIDRRFDYIESSINTIRIVGEKLGELEPMNAMIRKNPGIFTKLLEKISAETQQEQKKENKNQTEISISDIAMGLK